MSWEIYANFQRTIHIVKASFHDWLYTNSNVLFFFLILLLSLENFERMKNRFAFFRVFNKILVVDLALDRPKWMKLWRISRSFLSYFFAILHTGDTTYSESLKDAQVLP